jgi:hypothetical protein
VEHPIIVEALTSLFGHKPFIQKGGEELSFFCPKCHHYKRKLNVNVETGQWHCWVCDFRGKTFATLLNGVDAPSEFYAILKTKRRLSDLPPTPSEKLTLMEDFHPLWKRSSDVMHRLAINYCISRGLTPHEIIRYNIGYSNTGDFRNRIILPSYDAHGELNFFCGREFSTKYIPYRLCESTKNIIGFESMVNFKYQLTLVEGTFDAFTVKYNAIPLFGKTMSDKLKIKLILEKPPRVNVLLDSDAMGSSLAICDFLIQNNIETYLIILDGKDPNEIGHTRTWDIINQSEQITGLDLFKLKVLHKL